MTAAAAQNSMVGMSKDDVLTCMGPPGRAAQAAATEVWSYASGGDYVSGGTATAQQFGSTATVTSSGRTQARSCTVNIVFQNDRVTAVNYSGRTGGLLTQGEQCAFAVQNCVD